MSKQSAPGRFRWSRWLTLALMLSVGGPALLQADYRKDRLRRLQNLSDTDKKKCEQLRANLQKFRALPLEEQEALRELQRALDEDEKAGGHLRQVMRNYHEWLGTLTDAQREELQKISDPAERCKKIREFKAAETK